MNENIKLALIVNFFENHITKKMNPEERLFGNEESALIFYHCQFSI